MVLNLIVTHYTHNLCHQLFVIFIGVRAGGRGEGGCGGGAGGCRPLPPPPILGNSNVFGQQEKFGQSQFLRKFPTFFYYFEEIDIF